jgi:hypothetical protein
MNVVHEPQFESVITETMRDTIGIESVAATYEVTSTNVRMFARAVGYDDPVYYDRTEAQRRGYRDLPAPPGFLGTPVFDPKTSNATFGTTRDSEPWVRSPYPLILNGGTDVEYMEESVVAGDELTAVSTLEGLTERYSEALGGPMLIQMVATTFRNSADLVVAIVRSTSISYGPNVGGATTEQEPVSAPTN